ncbi:MAG: hypothetical protein WDO68_22450 [Gammaproteobacteria bacterium]
MHTAVSDNSPAAVRPEIVRDRAVFLAIAATGIALWIASIGYWGLLHDARLYSMQALARLQPELLGHDLYLRFGSQDRFTLFSPLYSATIAQIGLEPAAALLTFLSQLAFFTAAAFVARRLLPTRLALLSIALLTAIPIEYGPGNMFHAVEPFITPRMAAEALTLAALAATLSKKPVLVAVFLIAGLLLHPLMAMAGAGVIFAMTIALPRPRLAAMLGIAAIVVLALLALVPALHLDEAWRTAILDRMGYVFLAKWSVESWARTCVPLVTLGVALITLPPSRARSMAMAAMLTGLAGLLLTAYGADFLRITLIVQSQPWRWLWVTNTVMIVLLPLIFSACWERGHAGRATLAALVAMWLFRYDAYCTVLMPVALGLALFSGSPASHTRAMRMLWFGLLAVVAFGVAWSVANNVLFSSAINPAPGIATPVGMFRGVAEDGLAPAAALLMVWLIASHGGRTARTAVAILTCAIGACLLPFAFREWTTVRFGKPLVDAYGTWRAHIPVGTEVLWMEDPIAAWVLLQRPLFLSVDQTGSVLFSRAAAVEMERRDAVLTKYLPEAHFMMPKVHVPAKGHSTLERACSSGEIRFIATRIDLGPPALEQAPAGTKLFRGVRLYQCNGSNG